MSGPLLTQEAEVDMQLLLRGGSTGTNSVPTTAIYYPITKPVLALGIQEIGALVEVPAGLSGNLSALLAYRWFSDDDSQSAGGWNDVGGTAQAGPGKAWQTEDTLSGSGMRIQLGLKLFSTSGTVTGRGLLKSPMVVTT